MSKKFYVHPTAIVEEGAQIGDGASVWHFCHVRAGAVLGEGVSLGRDVYVDRNVTIGKFSRVQNGVSIFQGVEIGDYCFVGPHVIFTNDPTPRVLKKNWIPTKTILKSCCSLGAGSIIRCGVTIGHFAMTGAGAVVTKDVSEYTLTYGLPSKEMFRICACGESKTLLTESGGAIEASNIFECCKKNLPEEMLNYSK